jgi:hypothetical protein
MRGVSRVPRFDNLDGALRLPTVLSRPRYKPCMAMGYWARMALRPGVLGELRKKPLGLLDRCLVLKIILKVWTRSGPLAVCVSVRVWHDVRWS